MAAGELFLPPIPSNNGEFLDLEGNILTVRNG